MVNSAERRICPLFRGSPQRHPSEGDTVDGRLIPGKGRRHVLEVAGSLEESFSIQEGLAETGTNWLHRKSMEY